MRRSPFTLPYSSLTRWQLMQVTPSRETCARAHSGASRGSLSVVPTPMWQRTQKVPMLGARSLIFCSNLWNIGEMPA